MWGSFVFLHLRNPSIQCIEYVVFGFPSTIPPLEHSDSVCVCQYFFFLSHFIRFHLIGSYCKYWKLPQGFRNFAFSNIHTRILIELGMGMWIFVFFFFLERISLTNRIWNTWFSLSVTFWFYLQRIFYFFSIFGCRETIHNVNIMYENERKEEKKIFDSTWVNSSNGSQAICEWITIGNQFG